MKRLLFFILISIASNNFLLAQTEKFGTWVELEFTKTFLEKFEFSIIPEFRFQDDFTMDKYQFDAKLAYEPFKFLELAAAYRIKTNIKDKGDEVTHRIVLDAKFSKDFDRFETSFRTRFTTYNNIDNDGKTTMIRPRFKVGYDIRGNKLFPFVSYELFQSLSENELKKGRFTIGVSRKIGEIHRIAIYYGLQHYYIDDQTINILGIDYRLKF
ncbi:MAG: DUF2490 domain-containing protein [Draconibacterium sp.]|nr:DUF2490 domain-containing protein [Draconibacterium sp.]